MPKLTKPIPTELSNKDYDTFRELEARLTKNPPSRRTRLVKRKQKYVSPFRRPAPESRVVTCSECKLPSTSGLPPFIAVERLGDGERTRILRHEQCPDDPKAILALLKKRDELRAKQFASWKKTQRTWKRH